jgi:hypothetical protein
MSYPFRPPLRPKSAPPICLKDVGPYFYLREDEDSDLFMDPVDLGKFKSVPTLITCHPSSPHDSRRNQNPQNIPSNNRRLFIVANMNLARTKVPVPEVYDYGYSGNCAYILMERIDAIDAERYINNMKFPVPRRLSRRVREIIADLASLGLSHNDLNPRNIMIMVYPYWVVLSIVNWDNCTPIHVAGEYARRVITSGRHNWDYMFLRHAKDGFAEMVLNVSKHPRRPTSPSRSLPTFTDHWACMMYCELGGGP